MLLLPYISHHKIFFENLQENSLKKLLAGYFSPIRLRLISLKSALVL